MFLLEFGLYDELCCVLVLCFENASENTNFDSLKYINNFF